MRGEWTRLPGGGVAHVCYSGRRRPICKFCNRNDATLECDYPIGEKQNGEPITCDAKICGSCARQVGYDRDHCPNHAAHVVRKTIRDPQTRLELERAGYHSIGAIGTCRACPQAIEWFKTPAGANMPMSRLADGKLLSHFIDCPARRQFSQANKKHAARAEKPKPQQTRLF